MQIFWYVILGLAVAAVTFAWLRVAAVIVGYAYTIGKLRAEAAFKRSRVMADVDMDMGKMMQGLMQQFATGQARVRPASYDADFGEPT